MCCCTPMVFSHESATRKGDARKDDALVFLFQELMLVVGLNWLMWVTINVALAV